MLHPELISNKGSVPGFDPKTEGHEEVDRRLWSLGILTLHSSV